MKQKIHLTLLLFSLFFSLQSIAQICSGTLTAVWRDDFGSGIPQLSPQGSPNITSGYIYQNSGVNSGNYSLVNKFDYFGSWHIVPVDHTAADTGGYFLVIDGNTAAPIFYQTTVSNVCPLTQYSFSTFAMNIDLPQFFSDQTFTFIISDTFGNQLATWDSPPITVTDTPVWVPMGFSFNSGNNTALKLQARFNATGYDDFAFDDFQFSVCGPTLSITSTVASNTCADSIPLFSILGTGYSNPVYQWQKKNTTGVFVDITGATGANFTDQSPSDSNLYKIIVGDGGLSCPIIETKLIITNCITSTCNNWLRIPNSQSYVTLGDIDIPGTQLTVEGLFNRDSALTPEGYASLNVVSKHWTPADANYLLRVDRAEITTSDGFFVTPDICETVNKKIYEAAMTYDGNTLKFYRNGFLMSQVACTGTMFQNDYPTTIAATANAPTTNTTLIGYLNEIRIWNVARTQAELQAGINTPLPNPTILPGLLGYYSFETLVNKQGNSSYNGTLHGNASINENTPNCSFVIDSCSTIASSPCNNWLRIPNYNTQDYVSIGDLDITGDKITVEASFAADTNYFIPSTVSYDLVSKHTGPSDCNYLLRPVAAEITTTNGFYEIVACDYKPKKIHHAALVYDGSTLKFYRNGFLMGSRPATGNLLTNDLITKIGNYAAGTLNGSLKGYMNEVRIWNIARTETEIKTYMNASLPTPTAQPGLVAYYTFDSLNNKQGNIAWNGTLNGAATIGNTVPNCNFFADSCLSVTSTSISGIINYYTPVTAFNPCNNKIDVEDASGFKVGDTVFLIQMKGAVIDSTNTANFGAVTDYKNAGNYEFNYIKTIAGNLIELNNSLLKQYDIPAGKVQLIRAPYYQNSIVTGMLSCLPWDGKKGGVLVFNVADTLALNDDIDVSGKGFRGGFISNNPDGGCGSGSPDYFYPLVQPGFSWDAGGAEKGEGIVEISDNRKAGKGRLANGGGGGNKHNYGGGGGGNYGIGGIGGDALQGCGTGNGGVGGLELPVPYSNQKIFLGGGGGRGDDNNQVGTIGANGGGIVIISSTTITGNNRQINASGASQLLNGTGIADGAGGGGGGGVILIQNNNYTGNLLLNSMGGKGGSQEPSFGCVGPGGGGGGGFIGLGNAASPAGLTTITTGGDAGLFITAGNACTNTTYGATSGAEGNVRLNYLQPVSLVPYKINIDSVRIKDSLTACKIFSFKGLAFTNTATIQSWQWSFGDNSSASTQNTTHTYSNAGNYNVKLVVTDINGCKDSIAKAVSVVDCPTTTGIINDYAAVASINICNNTIIVDDATKFNAGDTVVIMQMKGAAIDSANTINFGIVSNYNNAGRYEFNYVKSKTGNSIEFSNIFLHQYDAVLGKVQLIRVPYFQTFTVADTLTCLPWNGVKGGVLILNSATDVNLTAPINVSNKGFLGGAVGGGFSCGNISSWSSPTGTGGTKGEGIAAYIAGFEAGGARLANGGGGAYAANSGGGGGGNFGEGGLGGLHSNTCPSPTQSINGQAIDYTINNNNVFLGGAGGGGQQDNGAPVAAGGNGGGIVIVKAAMLNSNSQSILANGESVTTLVRDEGGAGGGAGGSILLFVNNYTGTVGLDANGGNGSSNDNQIYPGRCHGPGGGGGGGYVGLSFASNPANLSTTFNGGSAGFVLNPASACFNTTNGASNGVSGGFNFNLVIPEATVPFKKNIDSVRIKDSSTSCKTFDFKGLGYINTNPVQQWQWTFDDGGIDNTQNTTHTFTTYGPHNLKLVITDINGCKDSITKVVNTNGLNFDFTFEQTVCNPRSIIFKAIGDTTIEIFWSLGDGTIINNIRNPAHVYADTGTYLVQYSTGNINTGCIDTVKKFIFIGYRNADIILTPDTGICFGANKLLRSNIDSSLQFCWSPNSFLNNVNFANPITNTPSGIRYTLFATSEESNLIINGNFNNGNTGFNTDYDAGTTPLSTAEYIIATSSLNAGSATANCIDHTTGSGNMMIVRNDFSTAAQIWGQTVPVLPNTNYILSAWVQPLVSPNNVQLQFSIKGNATLDNITATGAACTWTKHFIIWNSGNNTTADFSIFNKATTTGADDYFAIDDVSLSLYLIKRDTVRITIDTPFVNTRTDTSVCESVSVQLNTVGAASYSWTPSTGLSNVSIASPVAMPTVSTKYFVTGTSNFGCKATDSVTISVKPKPVIVSTGDTIICRNTAAGLFADGGVSYSWTPAAALNNSNIANPVANATIVNTKYTVTVTGANNCSSKDSFTVTVKAIPVYSVSNPTSVCLNDKPQLNATGGDYYLWSPASSVSNANISNPLAIATATTTYSVLISDTLCNYDSTLVTTITVLPVPTITASKENDINCAIGSTQLTATGALQYNWTPASALNDASSATPIASPLNTTTYTVKGTDVNGCINTASIKVMADYSAKVTYSMPNAFSPNGDDKNDCFRIKYFGLVQEVQLTIYNRWGEKVFFTTNPGDCWDGTFKGNPCDPGNFIYYLKAKTTCGPVEKNGNVLLIR